MILEDTIKELILYKKGDIIPNPNGIIRFGVIPNTILNTINIQFNDLIMSRRSLFHILQKEKVGIDLIKSIKRCLDDFDLIFLSDKAKSENIQRFLVLKRNMFNLKDVGVVIEYIKDSKHISIITAMIADEKYLSKKYKKLR